MVTNTLRHGRGFPARNGGARGNPFAPLISNKRTQTRNPPHGTDGTNHGTMPGSRQKGREASKYNGFVCVEPIEPMEPCVFPSWQNALLFWLSNSGAFRLLLVALGLAGGEHGGRGPFHRVAYRVHRQAGIDAGGVRALVPQRRADDGQAGALYRRPTAQAAA